MLKARLQIIGLGGAVISILLLGIGVGLAHTDAAALPGGIGLIGSVILKCLGDAI